MQSVFAAMGRCPLFEGIPEEKYPNVLTCLQGEARAVSKDQVLLRMGERQSRPGVVMWGTLRISLYSEDGNLLTIERLDAGMVFGESLVCSMAEDSPIQIDAITDGEVLYLDFDPLLLQQENACPFRTRVTANLLREMGRGELAEYLCVDRSALSRELGRMQKDGILTYQGQTVQILDQDFLTM